MNISCTGTILTGVVLILLILGVWYMSTSSKIGRKLTLQDFYVVYIEKGFSPREAYARAKDAFDIFERYKNDTPTSKR